MFEGWSDNSLWILLAAVAAVFFVLGRKSAEPSNAGAVLGARVRDSRPPAEIFAGLSSDVQRTVDQLLTERKIIEAVKTVRAAGGNLGLYESKQVVDWRCALRAPTRGT